MSAHYDLDDYHWLVGSSQATRYLDWVRRSDWPLHRLAASLRRDLSAVRTHLVLEQVALRRRAADKFERAEQMFFASTALEQATDQWVARYKAARFPRGPLADLCCGLGGDLMELAADHLACGVDRDRLAALLADVNCRAVGRTARLSVGDVASVSLDRVAAWHVDPDRRASGRRRRNLEYASPPLARIEQWRKAHPTGAIKLSPASDVPAAWSDQAELEWISRAGHCRQLVAWFGELTTQAGHRRATLFGNRTRPIRTVVGSPGEPLAVTDRVHNYVFQPDPAVLAANLEGALANQLGLTAALPGGVFFTADRAVQDAAVDTFEVIEAMPYHAKRVRQLLRQHAIDAVEVKMRGVDMTESQLRRQLGVGGGLGATLLVIRVHRAVLAILARRGDAR